MKYSHHVQSSIPEKHSRFTESTTNLLLYLSETKKRLTDLAELAVSSVDACAVVVVDLHMFMFILHRLGQYIVVASPSILAWNGLQCAVVNFCLTSNAGIARNAGAHVARIYICADVAAVALSGITRITPAGVIICEPLR